MGIDFPQGFDDTLNPDGTNYAFTSDGGANFANLGGFAFLTRALNVDASGAGPLITLSPESGEVAPGETVDITVTFDGTDQEFGLFETDILVNSNDEANPTVTVETDFTVSGGDADPAAIEVDPLELTAEVEIGVDNPPVDEETFSVTNVGGETLDFDLELGTTSFTAAAAAERLANLDRSVYGLGNPSVNADLKVAQATGLERARILAGETVLDSLFLDSGVDMPGDFLGFGAGGPAFGMAIRFEVPAGGFDLNAVRNAVRTEDFGATDVLLQVFGGDALPDPTQLLTEQLIPVESVDGSFDITLLNEPQQFEEGDVFWIVHNYPMGIDFPQGIDDTLVPDGTNYAFTTDGGANFTNLAGFAVLVRALNVDASGTGPLITLSPESGEVAPGETVDITVTFDGTDQEFGLYETDILVNSNDEANPTVTVETDFTVSGGDDPEPGITFVLINADTDTPIGPLVDGDVIDLAEFEGVNLNIEAIADGAGSVVFGFNGNANFRTESITPFALGSDDAGDFRPLNLPFGLNILTATPFSQAGGQGEEGISNTISFTVLNSSSNDDIIFSLVNADTDTEISILEEGDVINLDEIDANVNIEAIVDGVASVVFDFNGITRFRTENIAPFALGSDDAGDFRPTDLPMGMNVLTATGFSGGAGTGSIVASSTISFEVVREPVDGIVFSLVNADSDSAINVLQDGDIINLTEIASNINIEAIADGAGSVVFGFNGNANFRTESVAPFALGSDDEGDFRPLSLPTGINTVTATAFSLASGQGSVLATSTITFEVVRSDANTIVFSLVNADTDTEISILEDGDVIDLDEIGANVNIEAVIDGVASVVFGFNGNGRFAVENIVPYALGSDDAGDFRPLNLPLGLNILTATGYSQAAGQGTVLASNTINFTVVESSDMMAISLSPNPSTDRVELSISSQSQGMLLKASLVNLSGQVIYSNITCDFRNKKSEFLDVSGLTRGLYILVLTDENGNIVAQEKLVKN